MKSVTVGTPRSHRIGMAAIVVTWIGATLSVPYSKVLMSNGFTAEDLLIVRSVICILLALVISGGEAWRTTPRIALAGVLIAVSSVCFYRAIGSWSVAPVAVLLSFQPVGNLAIVLLEGKRPSLSVIVSLVCLIAGTVLFLDMRDAGMNIRGLAWTAGAIVTGAIGFDQWSRGPRDSTVTEKGFWLSAPLLVIVLAINHFAGHVFDPYRLAAPDMFIPAILFTVPVVAYLFCCIVPYSPVGEMDVVRATVLMQIATPFVIKYATRVNGEHISWTQWAGALIVVASGMYTARETIRAVPKTVPVSSVSEPARIG